MILRDDVFNLTDISENHLESIRTLQRKIGNNNLLVGGFKYVFIFNPTWGNDPFWLIIFKWVGSTTNWIYIVADTFPGRVREVYGTDA